METPFQLYAALAPDKASLKTLLTSPLEHTVGSDAKEPSFAQSLTRLQHLRRHLFRAEDWDELSWLINEGSFFEEKRLRKNPILKFGPRRQLQGKVQHFYGRASKKIAALATSLEHPVRRLLASSGRNSRHLQAPPALAWEQFRQIDPDNADAPSPLCSAQLLLETAPTLLYLLDLVLDFDFNRTAPREHHRHLEWHAREVAAELNRPGFQLNPFARQTQVNRLLRIALEEAQSILLHVREVYLSSASGLDQAELDDTL